MYSDSLALCIARFLYDTAHTTGVLLHDFPMHTHEAFGDTFLEMVHRGYVSAEYARSTRSPERPLIAIMKPTLTLRGEQFLFEGNKALPDCVQAVHPQCGAESVASAGRPD